MALGKERRLRSDLLGRLLARRAEIEQTILARVFSVSDPAEVSDPAYVDGLRSAVSSALHYAIGAIEDADSQPGPIPSGLLTQARLAARNGVSLDTVLRRYFAGYTLLNDVLIPEAEAGGLLGGEELHGMRRSQAELFDRLIAAVIVEYRSEVEAKSRSGQQRRAKCVEKLLAGELADVAELDYDLHAVHIGAIVAGPGAEAAIRELSKTLDRRLLLLPRGEGSVWAWLGGQHGVDNDELERLTSVSWPAHVLLAIGEPGRDLTGWRLSHRQAAAALPVAQRGSQSVIRYSEVALLASMLQDEVLVTSLEDIYLSPLGKERDGGTALRQTLRAYFAAERNVSSAAASLKVTRHTVTNRLHAVEERLGRSLGTCAAEMEAALRLEELRAVATPRIRPPGS